MRPSANTNLMLPLPDTPTALPDCCSSHADDRDIFQPDEPPSQNRLRKLANYPLYDTAGDSIALSALFSPTCLRKTRMLLIFVRNFFCGNCQQYLLTLAEQLPPSSLPADTAIAIIGCGAPSLLPSYMELTHCPYPIYTDPSSQLYTKLGMTRTLKMGDTAPEYIKEGLFLSGLKSIMQGLKRLPEGDVRKAGDMNLNGGEFLFERRPGSVGWGGEHWAEDWHVDWCHRMRNTRDHTEVGRLRQILGIDREVRSKTWAGAEKESWGKRWQPKRSQTIPTVEKSHKRRPSLAKALRRMPSISLKRPNTGKSSEQSTVHEETEAPPKTVSMAAWSRPEELKNSNQQTRQRSLSKSKAVAQAKVLSLLPVSAGNMRKFDVNNESIAIFSVQSPGRASVRSSMTPQVGTPGPESSPLLGVPQRPAMIAVL